MGLYKFRKELIEKLINLNYGVYISLPYDDYVPRLQELDCECIETNFNRQGMNPISDIKLLINYIKIIKKIKPDVVLTYTIKPNIYGGMACRLLNIPYIANITGLGTAVENTGMLQKLTILLYKIALKKVSCVFFQNAENMQFFVENKIAIKNTRRLIPGSGVNLNFHVFENYPTDTHKITFIFIGRLMKNKGINELLEAAEKVKQLYPNIKFNIIGNFDEDYSAKIKDYSDRGIINYLGYQDNVHMFIKDSHAIILPSYHEGTANVLLEAASTGRPVLASNVAGCKETFDESISGFGFEVKNVESLFNTIIKFIETPYEQKRLMGVAGRKKMENEYNRDIVISAYLEEIERITKSD